MSDTLANGVRTKALYFVAFQTGFVALLTLKSGYLFDKEVALSVLLGGLIFLLPNALFTAMAFLFVGARQGKNVVLSFYLGEVLKLTLVSMLFVMAFALLEVVPLALLLGFIFSTMTQWTASLFLSNKNRMINGC
ncbi:MULTISPECIES: ATP synthase subunit I [Aliagarivorans]|uniref:ATP synthase subunit I n=1 Tax=Aliagarivorans TaxID=882379 RepID=UPI000686AB7A|nr:MULTISPECIES: ATP synthase subunit I [Aliagarivorans]